MLGLSGRAHRGVPIVVRDATMQRITIVSRTDGREKCMFVSFQSIMKRLVQMETKPNIYDKRKVS